MLPYNSESYSFRYLNKLILNEEFILKFSQKIDLFLINLLIRAHLISQGGLKVTLCPKIASISRGTSFSISSVINSSGRWKKMKRVWFKREARRIGPHYNLRKVSLSNTTLTTFSTVCPERFFCLCSVIVLFFFLVCVCCEKDSLFLIYFMLLRGYNCKKVCDDTKNVCFWLSLSENR